MTMALKVVMIAYVAVDILFGIGFIFLPSQLSEMFGFAKPDGPHLYDLAFLGVTWIVFSVFIIIAAVRDPLKHIMWVQCELGWVVLSLVVDVSSIGRGLVTVSQGAPGLIIDAVFTVALLALYPWRAKPGIA